MVDKVLIRDAGQTKERDAVSASSGVADAGKILELDAAGLIDVDMLPIGSVGGTVCAGDDARLADDRDPIAHATSHRHGGADEFATATPAANVIPKAGAGGKLAIGFIPLGTSDTTACAGDDPRLADDRDPTAHATSHKHGGADEIATATPAANVIAKAGAGGKLAIGFIPLGTSSTTACAGDDARLGDDRDPTAHGSSHDAGGSDELAIDAVGGSGSLRTLGTGALQACAGNDSRLSDERDPTAHAADHQHGGDDEIATATPAANAIPKAGADGKLAVGFLPVGTSAGTVCAGDDSRLIDGCDPGAHADSHQHGGDDEIATATPAANAIPKATAGGKLAVGFLPVGTTSSTVCVGNDARLSDDRDPTAHAASHQHGGDDELSTATPAANAIPKAGADGKLAVGFLPVGTTSTTVCVGNDARLADDRDPTVHAPSHQHGGADEIATATPAANVIPKAGAGGKLAIGFIPLGTSSTTACAGDDARLADDRDPTAHAASHNAGAADALPWARALIPGWSLGGAVITLGTTTRKIKCKLSGAGTASNFFGVWSDSTPAGLVTADGSSAASNGTNYVDVIPAPAASTQRQCAHLYVYNGEVAPITVTTAWDDNGTVRIISVITIPVGSTLDVLVAPPTPAITAEIVVDAPAAVGSLRTLGTAATSACAGNDARLADHRTPTAHAASHATAGSDPLSFASPLIPCWFLG